MEATFDKMQKIISKKGYVDAEEMKRLTKKMEKSERFSTPNKKHVGGRDLEYERPHSSKRGKVQFNSPIEQIAMALLPSDVTIYNPAVQMKSNMKRTSTSSEEEMDFVDSSDEMDYLEHNLNQLMADNFIADMKKYYDKNQKVSSAMGHGSQATHSARAETYETQPDRLTKLIHDAEASKAKVLGTPGTYNLFQENLPTPAIDLNRNFAHSVMVDETYMLVASQLDELNY